MLVTEKGGEGKGRRAHTDCPSSLHTSGCACAFLSWPLVCPHPDPPPPSLLQAPPPLAPPINSLGSTGSLNAKGCYSTGWTGSARLRTNSALGCGYGCDKDKRPWERLGGHEQPSVGDPNFRFELRSPEVNGKKMAKLKC